MQYRRIPTIGFLIILSMLAKPQAAWPQTSEGEDVLGEVRFENSCAPGVQDSFDRAVALLHSFEYGRASDGFAAIAQRDPTCAMAHWGVAMTFYHPLWAPPTEQALDLGSAAAERARNLRATDREEAYIEAISVFYHDHDRVDHGTRAGAYEQAMAGVHDRFPTDREAELFYLLSTLSNVDPADKSYAVQMTTGARLEALVTEMASHPGVLHYLIHSYDYPPLAGGAVQAARRYLDVAPSSPHALHMSSHIFTQEGMWEASIEANLRSEEAAGEVAGATHALDYLAYAYLQRGQDEQARAVVERLGSGDAIDWGVGGVAFNTGAVAARYALERRAWDDAASLPPLPEATSATGGYYGQVAVAVRHWTRAVGAARSGHVESGEEELQHLRRISRELRDHPDVWARNTSRGLELQAAAWLELEGGEEGRALELMRSAAVLEDETDKSSLSPGRVLPAREQLGDLLVELGRPQEALGEYEASLQKNGYRFNSVYGAARAARAAGGEDVARAYFEHLLEVSAPDSRRPEVREARDFLEAR